MNGPIASVVVPTRGGAERLPHLFDCLRAQTETSWEVIIVVDGDTDDTTSILEQARRELPLTPIVFPENRGRSEALNAGFAAARGEVLIRCDDDLRPGRDYVAAHVARHATAAVGVIGLCRNVYPPTPYARVYGTARDARFRHDAYASAPENYWRFWAGNVSTTRDAYERVGGYDVGFRTYGWEDVDWGYRLHQARIEVVLAAELETDHYGAATTTESRVRRAFYAGAARLTFDRKHGTSASGSLPSQAGLWNRLIWHTAQHNDLAALLRRSRRTDRMLGRVPRAFAEKQVSWLVEAAALSGALHPTQVNTDV